MADVIGDWKRHQVTRLRVRWQSNFFDHRIRSDGEHQEKAAYIRRNPVARGLCQSQSEWPWVFSDLD